MIHAQHLKPFPEISPIYFLAVIHHASPAAPGVLQFRQKWFPPPWSQIACYFDIPTCLSKNLEILAACHKICDNSARLYSPVPDCRNARIIIKPSFFTLGSIVCVRINCGRSSLNPSLSNCDSSSCVRLLFAPESVGASCSNSLSTWLKQRFIEERTSTEMHAESLLKFNFEPNCMKPWIESPTPI